MNSIIESREILGKLGGTWEQKASHLANLNGQLMKEVDRLKEENESFTRIYNNACVMRDHYKNRLEALTEVKKP